MYTRGVRFFAGRVNSRATIRAVLGLVQSGRLRPEAVTSELVPWDDAATALASPSIKPVMVRARAIVVEMSPLVGAEPSELETPKGASAR
jgi:hypothetical protein